MDIFTRPWKIQCPDCKRLFPSNDFGKFYELGIDEHGNYRFALALHPARGSFFTAAQRLLHPSAASSSQPHKRLLRTRNRAFP
ncbi:MAG: hypothetical protein IJ949_03830, partial [Oscillospiraceae bacterium]|nr:hypothetical protein [Oscillospiraceae bacterium]